MEERTDVVMLGVGTGGEDVALQLLGAGLDVVGIEPALVGGECPYWACIPSKMMIRAANALQEARRVNGLAGTADVIPDWTPVARRIRDQASGGWDDSTAVARFEGRGGRFMRGRGRLTGPHTVAVDGRSFTAERGIVIATGSHPVIPPIPGLADVDYWTTHDAISVERLPASLVVLGGGAVGCELGQVFSRFGVAVTIVEGLDRLLAAEEPEASAAVEAAFAAEGIGVRTGVQVVGVEAGGAQVAVLLDGGERLGAERLLVATGRRANLEGLGLETTGIDASGRFLPVDDRLRAADRIWAFGDVTGAGMFTSKALYQAAIVAADVLGEEPPPADYTTLSRVTFTDPEVGSVGLSEAAALDAGIAVAVAVKGLGGTFRGWIHGPAGDGLVKLVADRHSGLLVGATAVGPHGGEVLGMLATAIHAAVPLDLLGRMIYAFPTFHGAIGEAIGAYARGVGRVLDPAGSPMLPL